MRIPSFLRSIPRKWRTPRVITSLFVIELLITVAALALYGIASPDLYRTQLWQEGSDHGWNSNPDQILYAYANYRPIHYPRPWSQDTTYYNVIIAVTSLFILLLKGILFITHLFDPLISTLIHTALIAIYAVSIRNQTAPDMSDPDHPQPGAPWYITKSCGPPVSPHLKNYCTQAKACFAVTILLVVLFTIYLLISLISLYPTASHRASLSSRLPDEEESEQKPWEMMNAPRTPGAAGGLKSPGIPPTPRTMAFNTLTGISKGKKKEKGLARPGNNSAVGGAPGNGNGNGGRVELRHHISMGDDIYAGPSGAR